MTDVVPDVAGAAKGKIGKFPVWLVALVIVGGGAALLWVARSRSGSTATSSTGTTSEYSTTGIPSSSSSTDIAGSSGSSDASATSGTNATWLARAVAKCSLALGASPLTVYGALNRFVNGEDYSAEDRKYIDWAVDNLGMPPEGTLGVGSLLSPATTSVPGTSTSTPDADSVSGAVTGVVRERGTYNLYATYADGTQRKLSTAEWIAMGAPQAQEINPMSGTTNFDLPIKYLRQRLTYDLYAQYEDGRVVPISDQQWRDAGSPTAEETNMFAGQEKKWQ